MSLGIKIKLLNKLFVEWKIVELTEIVVYAKRSLAFIDISN